jgi:hypothetical protein
MPGLFDLLMPDLSYRQFEQILNEADNRVSAAQEEAVALYANATKPHEYNGMSQEMYALRRDAWVPADLASIIVDKRYQMLYGREVARETGSEALDALLRPVWQNMAPTMARVCRIGAIEGDCFIRIVADLRARIKYSVWPGSEVVVIFDPDDPQSVLGVIYDYLNDPIRSQLARALGGSGDTQDVKEIVTRHIRDPYTGAILQPGIRVRFIDGHRVAWDDADTGLNPLGDFLDGVLWRNKQDPYTARGASDIEPIRSLLNALNELFTDGHELLLWNLWPITTITGDVEKQPAYSPRSIINLAGNPDGSPGEMRRLEWSENMTGYMGYFRQLLDLLYQVSGVPGVSLGDLSGIGNLASGLALKVAYGPLFATTAEREQTARTTEIDLMATSIAALANMGYARGFTDGAGYPDLARIYGALDGAKVAFDPMPVASSDLETAQVHQVRIGSGYESEETAIRATHPEWTDEEITAELDRVGKGKADVADAAAQNRILQMQQEMAAERQQQQAAGNGSSTAAAQ